MTNKLWVHCCNRHYTRNIIRSRSWQYNFEYLLFRSVISDSQIVAPGSVIDGWPMSLDHSAISAQIYSSCFIKFSPLWQSNKVVIITTEHNCWNEYLNVSWRTDKFNVKNLKLLQNAFKQILHTEIMTCSWHDIFLLLRRYTYRIAIATMLQAIYVSLFARIFRDDYKIVLSMLLVKLITL
jgi:hypothetical protein